MAVSIHRSLPSDLAALQSEIEGYAREYGLDFFPTIFEVLDYDELSEIAAYGGFPTRYPHWRFGMQHEELSRGYAYGLQKIYEMVINNNPCYAYLLRSNALTDQKLVMAHVYGHCDFFKNNIWFSQTSRKMMDEMANHGNRVRKYMDKYGVDAVEEFIDACLSIEDLIDLHSPFIQRRRERSKYDFNGEPESETPEVGRFRAKQYMDGFINPPEVLKREEDRIKAELEKPRDFPEEPEKDVMLFLREHAPLEPWQRDVLSIIREEAYYFAPQAQTKIMNEGWASYWHSTIMTRKVLDAAEVVDYADHHSGTMGTQPGRLNPYKLGIELLRDIEDRWNKGRFGSEYEQCDDRREQANWDRKLGLGREKIFEVRKIYNDVTFIDTFLTAEFCREHKLFSFAYNNANNHYEIEGREFARIKQRLLFSLTNFGRPFIYVHSGNHANRGELYLYHRHAGVDLQMDYARDTLKNVQRIWGRPVHLETQLEGQETVLSFDGSDHQVRPRPA
jgi:stage V sporulation protein R